MRRLLLILAAGLALAGPLSPMMPAGPAMAQGPATPAEGPAAPDFPRWQEEATAIEGLIADPEVSDGALEARRQQLVTWRETFQAAQGANTGRISTLRSQLEALGPAPAADAPPEAPEIAERRSDLSTQINTLEAPGIAAVEAYSRADNLIKEIDRILRDRQAEALLEVWPSPLSPGNWADALRAAAASLTGMAAEIGRNSASDFRMAHLRSNLPLIGVLLVFAAVVLLRGRRWMEAATARLQENATARGSRVASQVVSLGQVVLPVAGVLALSRAIELTGMAGPRLQPVIHALPWAGFSVFAALWLAGRLFPKSGAGFFNLPPERLREARVYIFSFGLLLAIRALTANFIGAQSQAAAAVLTFPLVAVAGMLLFRFGQILRQHGRNAAQGSEEVLFRNRLVGYVGWICIVIGVLAPVLAAVGYVPAANALVYPAGMTLALMGLVMFLQLLAGEVHAMFVGEEASRDALVPVLVGFVLFAMAVPVAALIWGARASDLAEVWLRFREGFDIGGVRISPTMFLTFAVVFAIGYTATKLIQGALKTTILPKTRLDQGGQTALVSGVGYIGIVLASLMAITTAGINLSSLAILAGALSVGIGFGLQNIVQNFVSGIILLIERPVSEGDWIEVGGVQGRVRAISVRSTRIETFDRNHVIVPNASLVTGTVTNWTRFNLSGRLLQQVTVSGANDHAHVQKVLEEIARTPPMVILNPPPSVGLIGLDGGNLTYEMRLILRDVNFKASVQNEVLHLILRRFAEEGIVFGVMGTSKTMMVDGGGLPYVPAGAVVQRPDGLVTLTADGPGPVAGGPAGGPADTGAAGPTAGRSAAPGAVTAGSGGAGSDAAAGSGSGGGAVLGTPGPARG